LKNPSAAAFTLEFGNDHMTEPHGLSLVATKVKGVHFWFSSLVSENGFVCVGDLFRGLIWWSNLTGSWL